LFAEVGEEIAGLPCDVADQVIVRNNSSIQNE
jgi:hypothetical protein